MNALTESQAAAHAFINQLAAGDFAGAYSRFDSRLRQALPEDKLKETWQQLVGQFGPFQAIVATQALDRPDAPLVMVTVRFEKLPLDFRLVYNPAGELTGLTAQPSPGSLPYHPPDYIQPTAFHEVEVTVGAGEWALPGTLSLPHGAGPFPAVVLVHGSGPQDRDESIGPNRPFRDLAGGLASRGIACLRYDKRSKVHAARFTAAQIANITVEEEVIADALAAVHLLRQTAGIDPARLYVLGHSLGATLAPRIGQRDPALAGLIILAGMTRPFEDTILDQFTYIYGLGGGPSAAQQAELDELKVKVARVKDPHLSDAVPASDLPLGLHAAYWLALRGYQPAAVAKTLAMRILVLQGGRDYQVTAADDFPAWQKALAGDATATLKLYPKLFHLFIEGAGPGLGTPQDYQIEGHVSPEVIRDIADWIQPPAA
jgi:dienelactone hydrolase